MFVRKNGKIENNYTNMDMHTYLKQSIQIKKELLQKFNSCDKLVIFDIGCCEGEDSIKYTILFPYSKIYSFEPLPDNYKIACKNIKKMELKNIKLYNLALSDRNEEAVFYVSSGNPNNKASEKWNYGNKSSSLLKPNQIKNIYEWLKFNKEIIVKTTTLNDIFRQEKIDHIDLIHMDVQGAELKVLAGAGEMLKKIKMIWLEVETVELYKSQPLKKNIENFFKTNHFTKIKDTTGIVSGDQLYINNNHFSKIEILSYKIADDIGTIRKQLNAKGNALLCFGWRIIATKR